MDSDAGFLLGNIQMKPTQKYGREAQLALNLRVKLARAFSVFHSLTARDIALYDLAPPQFSVLECLGHLGSMTIGTLSKKCS